MFCVEGTPLRGWNMEPKKTEASSGGGSPYIEKTSPRFFFGFFCLGDAPKTIPKALQKGSGVLRFVPRKKGEISRPEVCFWVCHWQKLDPTLRKDTPSFKLADSGKKSRSRLSPSPIPGQEQITAGLCFLAGPG